MLVYKNAPQKGAFLYTLRSNITLANICFERYTTYLMGNEKTLYTNLHITNQENSEVEITGEITVEATATYRERAIKNLGKDVEMPGFRKGHIPESVLVSKLGEQVVLSEIAELALTDVYTTIVLKNNLKVIGRPNITITKLAPNNPIGFKIVTAVMPEIKLPDYKAEAKDVMSESGSETIEVSDKEVEDTIGQIQKNIAGANKQNETDVAQKEEKLPELNDELVKKLGEYKDVADFKNKLKEQMIKEKQMQARSKMRAKLGDKLIEKSVTSLPKILVESELEKMLGQFKHDVAAMGTPFEKYLEKTNKTEEDLKNDWKVDAEKRAKLQLILNTIATEEKITPEEEGVKKQTDHILEHHKDANEENVRIYVTTLLTNEKVFQFLEEQK